jgi:DNA-binding LacI/PurR family transcriptional regulator
MEPAPTEKRGRTPTIRDVARLAGVGVGTVSRVLNDSPLVSPETELRVRDAIEQLGYRRSAAARNLSLGNAQAIGVVAPFFTSPSVVERMRGVAERLAERGYDLMLFDVETPQQRADALGDFARRVDGLLVISLPLSDEEVVGLQRDDLPVVLVDVGHEDLPHVVIDNVEGGRLATQHLIDKGHRRIGFIGDMRSNPFGFTSSERRRHGYELALRAAEIEPEGALQQLGGSRREAARALADALLDGDDPPTAVFAASDIQAMGVLESAAAHGLAVPDDLAVIGFDDIEMAAVLELSTVRQPLLESGTRGADLLLEAIERGDRRAIEDLEPLAVIERSTT